METITTNSKNINWKNTLNFSWSSRLRNCWLHLPSIWLRFDFSLTGKARGCWAAQLLPEGPFVQVTLKFQYVRACVCLSVCLSQNVHVSKRVLQFHIVYMHHFWPKCSENKRCQPDRADDASSSARSGEKLSKTCKYALFMHVYWWNSKSRFENVECRLCRW